MIELDLYTVGGVDFMSAIMRGLALIFGYQGGSIINGGQSNGAGYAFFYSLLKLFFVLGIITTIISAMSNPEKGLNFGPNLTGLIIFIILFSIPCQVRIVDAYVANVSGFGNANYVTDEHLTQAVISNVPLGVVMVGSITSSAGRGLYELFTAAYTPFNHPQFQFAEPLEMLQNIRSATSKPSVMGALNKTLGGNADFTRSIQNYIQACTLLGVELRVLTIEGIYESALPQALRFDSSMYTTVIYTELGPVVANCTDAYSNIAVMWGTVFQALNGTTLTPQAEALRAALMKATGLIPKHTASATNLIPIKFRHLGGTENVLDILAEDLDALHLISDPTNRLQEAQSYIMTSLIDEVAQEAAMGRYKNAYHQNAAIAIRDAIERQNTEWSMEGNMFKTYMVPMSRFIEGFVYALAPLMAMMVLFGAAGFKLVMKYLALVIWVQLWLPIMAITNLYVIQSAAGEMLTEIAGLGSGAATSSIYMATQAAKVAETYIATGGMMIGATASLALMLVYGSAVAATSLASRLQGNDHIREEQISPQATQIGPVMGQQVMYVGTHRGGTMASGMADKKLSLSTIQSSQLSNIDSQIDNTQTQLGYSLSQSAGGILTERQTTSLAHLNSQTMESSQIASLSGAHGYLQQVSDELGLDNTQRNELSNQYASQLALNGDLKLPTSKTKVSALGQRLELSAAQTDKWANVESTAWQQNFRDQEQLQLTDQEQAQFRQGLGTQAQVEGRESTDFGATWQSNRQVNQGMSQLEQLSETRQAVNARSNQFTDGYTISYGQFAAQLRKDEEAATDFHFGFEGFTKTMANKDSISTWLYNQYNINELDYGHDSEQGRIAAQLESLSYITEAHDQDGQFIYSANERYAASEMLVKTFANATNRQVNVPSTTDLIEPNMTASDRLATELDQNNIQLTGAINSQHNERNIDTKPSHFASLNPDTQNQLEAQHSSNKGAIEAWTLGQEVTTESHNSTLAQLNSVTNGTPKDPGPLVDFARLGGYLLGATPPGYEQTQPREMMQNIGQQALNRDGGDRYQFAQARMDHLLTSYLSSTNSPEQTQQTLQSAIGGRYASTDLDGLNDDAASLYNFDSNDRITGFNWQAPALQPMGNAQTDAYRHIQEVDGNGHAINYAHSPDDFMGHVATTIYDLAGQENIYDISNSKAAFENATQPLPSYIQSAIGADVEGSYSPYAEAQWQWEHLKASGVVEAARHEMGIGYAPGSNKEQQDLSFANDVGLISLNEQGTITSTSLDGNSGLIINDDWQITRNRVGVESAAWHQTRENLYESANTEHQAAIYSQYGKFFEAFYGKPNIVTNH